MTWKALKANLKVLGFTPEEVKNLVNDKGEELFKRMMDDRERRDRGDEDAPVWVKHYYDKLKAEFAPSDTPTKKLKVKDESEPIEEELILSLQDLHGGQQELRSCEQQVADGAEAESGLVHALGPSSLEGQPCQRPGRLHFPREYHLIQRPNTRQRRARGHMVHYVASLGRVFEGELLVLPQCAEANGHLVGCQEVLCRAYHACGGR